MEHAKGTEDEIADSWEDEATEVDLQKTTRQSATSTRIVTPSKIPDGPTKSSIQNDEWDDPRDPSSRVYQDSQNHSANNATVPPLNRPDKTTAVASRLIAAGLGQRAPRRTKEEREYDQAMRLQEKKRRDQAREAAKQAELDAQKAKQAIWDD